MPSDIPPTPHVDSSGMTQTPLTEGLPLPVTTAATRQPLLVSHKAAGGATTQTLTTNDLAIPNLKMENSSVLVLKTSSTPESPVDGNGLSAHH